MHDPPLEMRTQSSPGSARSAASKGLAYLPYLTIGDIIQLRELGIDDVDSLEARLMEVPASVWPNVLALVRARVLQPPQRLPTRGDGEGPFCRALTQAGEPCRNPPRDGSDYCASHKGYQPTEIEKHAREQGLLP